MELILIIVVLLLRCLAAAADTGVAVEVIGDRRVARASMLFALCYSQRPIPADARCPRRARRMTFTV
jgi:hypothetical protein